MSVVAEGLGYVYPSGERGVGPVDLTLGVGERLLVCGPSGCGKSTLARLLVGLLQRHGAGTVEGRVTVGGVDPAALAPAARAAEVGFVGQVPSDQLVSAAVGDELASVLRWAGRPDPTRVVATLAQVGLRGFETRDPRALSGGEQQRLVVGAALVGGAPLLVLDEPLAMLDPAGARALLDTLARLAASGTTVVLVEHRLAACLPWADRVLRLEAGRVRRMGPPEPLPAAGPRVARSVPAGATVAEVAGLSWSWGETPALRGVSVRIQGGERVALVGANGAGKSTLLEALAGRIGPSRPAGRCVAVPQDPDLALYCGSVRAELADGPTEAGAAAAIVASTVFRLAERFDLGALLDRPPQSLSRGQRMRVAVAAALACAPDLLLLDEPTAGQDHAHVEAVFDALDAADGLGEAALVFATHDLGLAERRATRIIELEAGQIRRDLRP